MKERRIRVLFIHHSTGGLLIRFGKIRKLLHKKNPNIEFWDHGYNLYKSYLLSKILSPFTFHSGLSNQDGKIIGKDFDIVISNNSPKEYAEIFSRNQKDFTLQNILQFDVIAFKNCYPTSKIETKQKLSEFKSYYSKIIKDVSDYPNLFIIFTPPPLRKESTKTEWAKNARELADWLILQRNNNVKVFNFFDYLADNEGENANMLKREYCNPLFFDSHPNIKANRIVGRIFVDYLVTVVNNPQG